MASIASSGFDIKDAKVLVNSEPHADHGGGLTLLQQASVPSCGPATRAPTPSPPLVMIPTLSCR